MPFEWHTLNHHFQATLSQMFVVFTNFYYLNYFINNNIILSYYLVELFKLRNEFHVLQCILHWKKEKQGENNLISYG